MSTKENDIKALELELEQLRVKKTVTIREFQESKEKEIDEYISQTISTDSNFYAGYGSMLRKDLQHQYNKELEEIKERFELRENELISEIEKLKEEPEKEEKNNPIKEQVDLILELKKEQENFDSSLEELSNFKYEYNDQNQVVNGSKWR